MKSIENDNAAKRINYVSEMYENGIAGEKKRILDAMTPEYAALHRDGYIHIHDLEAYGKVYNCSIPDVIHDFPYGDFQLLSDHVKIFEIFNYYRDLIVNLATEQTGGIGFCNFDGELDSIFCRLGIPYTDDLIQTSREVIRSFIKWINTNRTRYCREPYYLSFNLGLCTGTWGRKATDLFLNEFYGIPLHYTRPNIIFKVNEKINGSNNSPNHDLFQVALKCTAKRMIPTYLLTDSVVNKNINPLDIAIMGCRTRVHQNINGEEMSLGRGNVAYVSLNLPRLALEAQNFEDFYKRLETLMTSVARLLKDRMDRIIQDDGKYLYYVKTHRIWRENTSVRDMLYNGTLSTGFIGLSEAVEVLTGKKPYQEENSLRMSYEIIQFMRRFVDSQRIRHHLNFSLLATPGELLSGRFCEIDRGIFHHPVQEKEFYTKSFHVDVDSKISIFEKIDIEAPFHSLCNGGCISYIELGSAPLVNTLGLMDVVAYATQKGVSYLGFNYPLDICNLCDSTGTFDVCPSCGSTEIKRIRRVSGYLEDYGYFTKGKKAETKMRKANI